jgi:predicted Zn-dependent protease
MTGHAAPHEIVERALSLSTTYGCVVIVRTEGLANLRWARSTLTTNGETLRRSVTVIALVEVPGGIASGSVTVDAPTLEDLPAVLSRAEGLAVEDGAADDAAELVTGVAASGDWADGPERATAAGLARVASDIGAVLAGGRADGIEHFGYVEQTVTTFHVGTSSGVRLRYADHDARFEGTAKSHDRTRSSWVGSGGSTLDALDLPALDAELRRSLAWQARRVDLPPGRHPALLTPSATADLMIELYWSSVGRDAADGQSVWSRSGGGTRVGENVVDPRVSLDSDPSMPGFECLPFVVARGSSGASSVFDNGLPVGAVRWISDGVLANLITTRHTAAETGLAHRPDVDNLRLSVAGASGSLDDLVASTDEGVLVTCLWYNRVVDPQTLLLTGLTRDGVYVVRGGEVVGAASNFRFNDSPVDLLHRIEGAGTPVPALGREMADYFHRASMPPLLVRDFNFSTVSQAF